MYGTKQKFLKNKKAQGHIEMILSFVIFIGFILAIFFLFVPAKHTPIDYAIFDKVQMKILENLSFQYQTASLILNSNFADSCFAVEDPFNISSNVLVQDLNGDIKKVKKDGGKIYIAHTSNNRYYKLYFSDNFNSPRLSSEECLNLEKANYSFGVLSSEQRVLYENLEILNKTYLTDYPKLKQLIGFGNDFDFIIIDKNRNILFNESLSLHKLKKANVLSREFPLAIIDKNASKRDLLFILEVW